jgi:hypothetical protein
VEREFAVARPIYNELNQNASILELKIVWQLQAGYVVA